jgi:hypothetical protein
LHQFIVNDAPPSFHWISSGIIFFTHAHFFGKLMPVCQGRCDVTEPKDKRTSGIRRYSIASQRTSPLLVIPFGCLAIKTYLVRIADLSVTGLGIELNCPVETGLAFFEEPVGGHKFGIVAWCREYDGIYRAGINFIRLPQDTEQYLLSQLKQSRNEQLLSDPECIVEEFLRTIKPEAFN